MSRSHSSSWFHDHFQWVINIFSDMQDAFSLNWPSKEMYKTFLRLQRFINCKTTNVMDDFMPLWKVKQSALWNTELPSAGAPLRESVKNCVESHFKEARQCMSAFSFIPIEKVSLGPWGDDLNFIINERESPFESFFFKSLNPGWINGRLDSEMYSLGVLIWYNVRFSITLGDIIFNVLKYWPLSTYFMSLRNDFTCNLTQIFTLQCVSFVSNEQQHFFF